MIVFLLLGVCVLIQSVYGVGLLLFGTPILLLSGLEYLTVLGALLPSSIMLSLFQIVGTSSVSVKEAKMGPIVVLGIICGFLILSQTKAPFQMSLIMASSMFLAAVLRSIPGVIDRIGAWLSIHRLIFHFTNAVFHGFSNLGGTLLTIYSTSVYKEQLLALRCTSVFYLIYAASQIAVLLILGEGEGLLKGLLFLPVTALIYIAISFKSVKLIGPALFSRLTTLFFWLAAFVFFVKAIMIEKQFSEFFEWV